MASMSACTPLDVLLCLPRLPGGQQTVQHVQVVAHVVLIDGGLRLHAVQGVHLQLCKSIGSMAAVLEGKVDGILLTGGLMRYDDILEGVEQRCGWIAPITVYPGECEQEAMADAVLEVLRGQRKANRYTGVPVFQGFAWDNK